MPKDLSLGVLSDPIAVLDFAGKGTGRDFLAKDLNNWAPNFSFAWDPFSSGKTSVRGGFSIAYAIDNNATVLNNAAVAGNAGLQSTATFQLCQERLADRCTGTRTAPFPRQSDLRGSSSCGAGFSAPRTLIDQLDAKSDTDHFHD